MKATEVYRGRTIELTEDGKTQKATIEAFDGERSVTLMARDAQGKADLIRVNLANITSDGQCVLESGGYKLVRDAVKRVTGLALNPVGDMIDASVASTIGPRFAALEDADRSKVAGLLAEAAEILTGGKPAKLARGERSNIAGELDKAARHVLACTT